LNPYLAIALGIATAGPEIRAGAEVGYAFGPIRMRHLPKLVSLIALPVLLSSVAHAAPIFHGDFETGDLTQWGYLLNEEGLSVAMDPVADGTHSGKVTITKDNLWSNGLNRVEVQYKPPAANGGEGAEAFYGYSFYLPEALSTDNHQILYWETDQTYQQVMHVAIEGQNMYFATQKPSFTKQWEAAGAATPGRWHRLVMRIKWSADAATGEVDLYFDGTKVVNAAKAQTYLGNLAFVQHGILRQPTSDKVEVMYMDDARFGTTLDDVMSTVPGGGGSGGAGGSATGGSASSGGAGGSAGGGNGGAATAGAANGGAATAGTSAGGTGTTTGGTGTTTGGAGGSATTAGAPSDVGFANLSDSSCSVAQVGTSSNGAWVTAAALLGLGFSRLRRRRSDR
jgi:MYXO-CTERM domain-containing protein